MKPDITKLLVAAWQTEDATLSAENNSQTPTALGPQLEDPPRAATARAATLVAVIAAAVVASAGAHHTVLAEELVAAMIAEAEATPTATSPTTVWRLQCPPQD
jgi:hexokinase